jgi:hypothetical protein
MIRVVEFDSHAHPQPLPERCDSVLMASATVQFSSIMVDMALSIARLVLPGLICLLWLGLPRRNVFLRQLALAPEAPPPRA